MYCALAPKGENNVFGCEHPPSGHPDTVGWDPVACGTVNDTMATGYACQTVNLIESWSRAWSITPNTTPAALPFGIVSLAGGTSEGHGDDLCLYRFNVGDILLV